MRHDLHDRWKDSSRQYQFESTNLESLERRQELFQVDLLSRQIGLDVKEVDRRNRFRVDLELSARDVTSASVDQDREPWARVSEVRNVQRTFERILDNVGGENVGQGWVNLEI